MLGLYSQAIHPVTQQAPTDICLQAPILAYVGRLAAQKGMDVLLSALPALLHSRASSQGVHSSGRHCADPSGTARLPAHVRMLGGQSALIMELFVTCMSCIAPQHPHRADAECMLLHSGCTMQECHDGHHCAAETDIAVSDSTWDEGKVEGEAAKKVQAVVLGTGESWMQRALAAMGSSFRGRAAGKFNSVVQASALQNLRG